MSYLKKARQYNLRRSCAPASTHYIDGSLKDLATRVIPTIFSEAAGEEHGSGVVTCLGEFRGAFENAGRESKSIVQLALKHPDTVTIVTPLAKTRNMRQPTFHTASRGCGVVQTPDLRLCTVRETVNGQGDINMTCADNRSRFQFVTWMLDNPRVETNSVQDTSQHGNVVPTKEVTRLGTGSCPHMRFERSESNEKHPDIMGTNVLQAAFDVCVSDLKTRRAMMMAVVNLRLSSEAMIMTRNSTRGE
ncbi:hypothetical protein BC835DRAFT_1302499 [Cytidiella melzeri]|nr:hypothetical protein BC835DRAFT_1302499 [Cytidiella melzeri]